MGVTLGDLTIDRLQAQPCGWEDTDVRAGLVARRWTVVGRVRSAQWLAIWDKFDTWQTARRNDPPTMASLAVGTTINFSGSSYGKTWSNVPCWFTAAPEGEAVGVFIRVSFELVAAADALAVMLRQQELSRLEDAALLPSYGTYTLGTVALTLLDEPDGFDDAPTMNLTATGTSVIQGPMVASVIKRINGWCAPSNKATLMSWYASAVQTRPTAGQWFPITDPQFSQDRILVNGAVVERLLVQITLKQAR